MLQLLVLKPHLSQMKTKKHKRTSFLLKQGHFIYVVDTYILHKLTESIEGMSQGKLWLKAVALHIDIEGQ